MVNGCRLRAFFPAVASPFARLDGDVLTPGELGIAEYAVEVAVEGAIDGRR